MPVLLVDISSVSTLAYQHNIYAILVCLKLTFWVTQALTFFNLFLFVDWVFVFSFNKKKNKNNQNETSSTNQVYDSEQSLSANKYIQLESATFKMRDFYVSIKLTFEYLAVNINVNSRQLKLKPPITAPVQSISLYNE